MMRSWSRQGGRVTLVAGKRTKSSSSTIAAVAAVAAEEQVHIYNII
jgi:hypothetical protein